MLIKRFVDPEQKAMKQLHKPPLATIKNIFEFHDICSTGRIVSETADLVKRDTEELLGWK